MSASRRAFSLAELLVAAGLAALLLVSFWWFLVPTMEAMARGSSKSEAEEQGALALERIERVLRTSGTTGIGVYSQSQVGANDPPGLYATPLEGVNGEGEPIWALQLTAFYWTRSAGRLMTKTWPPNNPASFAQPPSLARPAYLVSAEYLDLATSLNGSERSLASGVTNFDLFQSGTGPALVPPLRIEIELQRQEGHHHETFKFRRVFTLRTL